MGDSLKEREKREGGRKGGERGVNREGEGGRTERERRGGRGIREGVISMDVLHLNGVELHGDQIFYSPLTVWSCIGVWVSFTV